MFFVVSKNTKEKYLVNSEDKSVKLLNYELPIYDSYFNQSTNTLLNVYCMHGYTTIGEFSIDNGELIRESPLLKRNLMKIRTIFDKFNNRIIIYQPKTNIIYFYDINTFELLNSKTLDNDIKIEHFEFNIYVNLFYLVITNRTNIYIIDLNTYKYIIIDILFYVIFFLIENNTIIFTNNGKGDTSTIYYYIINDFNTENNGITVINKYKKFAIKNIFFKEDELFVLLHHKIDIYDNNFILNKTIILNYHQAIPSYFDNSFFYSNELSKFCKYDLNTNETDVIIESIDVFNLNVNIQYSNIPNLW